MSGEAEMLRPRLLWAAARYVADNWGSRPLRRAVSTVLDEEADLERARTSKSGEYSPRRHVEVLGEYLLHRERQRCT